ncbi:sensor histidine kinase [Bifidobacterium pseudocatenulatum]|uniref:sensor histidine kinase n=1 Tax=Bifidobacterium pseudocatenulatum TaxID=28026 RepID=UPI0015FBF879|nr:histidine kinase [Bifidobacterium pseudocatenulatum]
MVVCASFACLAQVSFASQQYAQDSAPYLWMIACVLVAIPSGLILLARNSYPQAVFWTACLLVVALPYDSLIALMALTSLLARRQGTKVTLRSVLAAATTTIWSQVRDALHPAEASIWHAIFSKPYTGVRYGNTMVMLVDERTIIASAVVVALIAVAIATLAGLHIRSRALARVAEAKAQSANEQVSRLRTTLDNQQLADAIAAEAHDTLAHSLSLLALNASALQAESRKLKAEAEQLGNANVAGMAGKIAGTTEDIRRQASGALDEAHSVIDMLRHPEDARLQLAANDAEASLTRDSLLQLAANDAEASLTRDSLLQLIGDARAANMRIDTWIDVQQLGQLDESIGVIAYHVVQEGLTNVRRHAPGAPVSLQVDANPPQGVHVHVSNPTTPQSPSHMADTRKGAGLPGLAKRIQQAGGTCQYGFDQHNVFHLDVRLPWVG